LGFNNADLVATNTTPLPGNGQSAETITTLYDQLLRPLIVTRPDNTSVTNCYLLTGELGQQSGSRTYPVAYTYDYAGRMQTMTTWTNFSAETGSRVTTWNYDPYRGWLTSKIYPDGNGPSYQYTKAGRLQERIWARGVTTTYGYDIAGELTTNKYSDGTPTVNNTYDNLGHLVTVVLANGMTDSLTYNLAGQLLTESFTGGPLNGLSVTNGYDQFLRRTNLTALSSSPLSETVKGSVLTICTLT
jgi:YD repeat-containing protein